MTVTKATARGPGRPRSFPAGTTGTDRKALSRRELRAAGGHVLTVDLGAAAWTALQKLAGRNARSAYIERLILEAAKRRCFVAIKTETTVGLDTQPQGIEELRLPSRPKHAGTRRRR